MNKKLSIIVLVFVFIFTAYTCIATENAYTQEEKSLIKKIQKTPSTLNYYALSQLRYKYAIESYKKWRLSGDKKDYEKALLYANSVTKTDSENDKAFILLGTIYSEAVNNQDALELATNAFADALLINPANSAAQLQLANVLMMQKRYWSAIEIFEDMFVKSEKMITGINTAPLALCYIADGRIEAGIDYFNKLEKKYPKNSGVLIAYSVLLKNNNRIKPANKKLNKLISSSDAGKTQKAYAKSLLAQWKEVK